MSEMVKKFFDAWSEDEASANESIGAALHSDASYSDPNCPETLVGAAAIAEYVKAFQANAPGWTAKVVKEDSRAGCVRATISFGGMGPDGKEMAKLGQYFVDLDGDKIKRLVGFIGIGEP